MTAPTTTPTGWTDAPTERIARRDPGAFEIDNVTRAPPAPPPRSSTW
jgi:hypothetical protein